MTLPRIQDCDLQDKRVLIRIDGDVPHTETGGIADTFRLEAALPTILHCLKQQATVVLLAHQGRPGGTKDPTLSNKRLADYFTEALKEPVVFVEDVHKPNKEARVVMLENLRFWAGEDQNSESFARLLAKFGDIYCNNAIAVSHQSHASLVALPKLLPHYAGLQMQSEIERLTPLRQEADAPYAVVLGGAKASDKSPIVIDLIDRAETIAVGGLVAVTYLAAMGCPIGAHQLEAKQVSLARQAIRKACEEGVELLVPIDFINQSCQVKSVIDMTTQDLMLDIGPKTQELFARALNKANAIFWNGAMGKFEDHPFSGGTLAVARAIQESDADVKIGSGGDTVSAIHANHYENAFTFISTGGGATLQFIVGRDLPAIVALQE